MMKPTLFIADLHLSPDDPATAQAFASFIGGVAREAAALYILGDLFEYWIGDVQLNNPFFAAQAQKLRQLSQTVPVFFLPGNRDFLPGKRFAREAGVRILPDPSLIMLGDQRVLIAHGDAYCTDDVAYQRFRRIIRHPLTRLLWQLMPLTWRYRKAAGLREKSRQESPAKMDYLMDVNRATIESVLQEASVKTLIHGHTHRPARHLHENGERWVLPDWKNGTGGYLRHDADGLALLDLDHRPLQ